MLKLHPLKEFSTALLVALATISLGCANNEEFPVLGSKIASPADVASSKDGEYFYILNADMDRTYNAGSILVLDREGERVHAISTPRLGRSLTVAGDQLIAVFDDPGPKVGEDPRAILYDLSDPRNPSEISNWQLDCLPISTTMRSGYQYFTIACQDGTLYVGDLTAKTVTKVRQYSGTRRAMHIDPDRGLLFAFVTDMGRVGDNSDLIAADEGTWDEQFNKIDEENEVPDNFENTRDRVRQQSSNRRRYQVAIYDFNEEAKAGFPYRKNTDPVVSNEYRWLYFNLTNFDGTPDQEAGYTKAKEKYYRTNFWEAKPDPKDRDSFFVSHRGLGIPNNSPDANSIVRVTITADPRPTSAGIVPKTKDILKFKRIYGFGGSQSSPEKPGYTGDFELVHSAGFDTVIVNNFRDLVNFRTHGGPRFSISAATLDPSIWFSELSSTSGKDGFYQLAKGKGDRIATCSFYGNEVILLDVRAGTDITEIKRIN